MIMETYYKITYFNCLKMPQHYTTNDENEAIKVYKTLCNTSGITNIRLVKITEELIEIKS